MTAFQHSKLKNSVINLRKMTRYTYNLYNLLRSRFQDLPIILTPNSLQQPERI